MGVLQFNSDSHSSILAWRIPWSLGSIVHGVAKSWTRLNDLKKTKSTVLGVIKMSCLYFSLNCQGKSREIQVDGPLECSVLAEISGCLFILVVRIEKGRGSSVFERA